VSPVHVNISLFHHDIIERYNTSLTYSHSLAPQNQGGQILVELTPFISTGGKLLTGNVTQGKLTAPIKAFAFIRRNLLNIESDPAFSCHNPIVIDIVPQFIVQMFLDCTTVRWLHEVREDLERRRDGHTHNIFSYFMKLNIMLDPKG
jgi:hypothetical protein